MSHHPTDDVEYEAPKTFPERLAEWIIVPLMLGIIAVGFAGVVMRFAFGGQYALFWAVEVVRYAFIWLFWLCVPVLVWQGAMFAVDIFIGMLPKRGQKLLRLGYGVAIIMLMGSYAYYGWSMAVINWEQVSSALRMPLFWIYISIPVGSILVIGVALIQMVQTLTGRERREGPQ